MSRVLRITLWITGSLILLAGLGIVWINSELKPEPLGRRVASLLREAQIKGGIQKVELSLDGNFNAEGVDLVLEDGTAIKATAINGQADFIASALGTPTLNRLSIKGLSLDLSKTKTASKPTAQKSTHTSPSTLPTFRLGPFNIAGDITLEEGKLISFNAEGSNIDSAGRVDLRGTISWTDGKLRTKETKPSANILLQGEFQRPIGQHGFSPTELVRDIKGLNIDCSTASGAGGMSLMCQGSRNASGHLILNGKLNDATSQAAVNFSLVEKDAELNGEIVLALDPSKFGVLNGVLPKCNATGKITIAANMSDPQNWESEVDLKIKWSDLSTYSKNIRPGLDSAWRIQSSVKNSSSGLSVDKLSVTGNGVELKLNKPLHWKAGTGIETLSATVSARDAELATFAPLLSSTHIIPTQGHWTGEAELALTKGDLNITTLRTHSLTGLTLEREGKVIAENLNGEIPLRTEGGTLIVSPFKIYSATGELIRGDVKLTLEKNSDWALQGKINLGVAEIAKQTGQNDLPIEKLRGLNVEADIELSSKQALVTCNKVQAKILRQDLELLKVKLLQPLNLTGAKPAGVLFEASATTLPLESLAVFVPGLSLTGSLNRANLVGGFQGTGVFIQSKEVPVELSDISLTWNKIPYLRHCDISTRVDVVAIEQKSIFNFSEISVQSKGKSLAAGSVSIGLNEFTAAINLKGDMGALAQQPIAMAVANLATGNYQAQVQLNAQGECTADLKVSEIGFKDRPAKIKAISINGTLAPQAGGFRAEGKCKIDGTGTTSGKLMVQKKMVASQSNWEIQANFDSIIGDDLLALVSQPENIQPAPSTINPAADRVAFWHGHTASVKLNIQSASIKGFTAEGVALQLAVTDEQISLTQLSGKFAEGTLTGTANCTFNPGNAGGPYQLKAQVGLQQFNFDPIAKAYPAIKDFVQGKGDATATANSTGINIDDLIAKVNVDANLLSKGGRIQAFGGKDSSTAVSASKAGQTAKLLGGIAKLAGALSKNKNQGEKIARAGEAMSAASKLQESLSDFKYDLVDVKVQRLANGTVKINRGLIQNPELSINALGQITAKVGSDFNDWPLALQATTRGKGTYAEQFKLLGFADASAAADGFTKGPSVQFTGSLNHLQNDLKERLQGAVKNIQSGGAPNENTSIDSPANSTAPAINPLQLLLGN
jgi:hypothetical protein